VTSTRLVYTERRIERSEIVAISTFANPDFHNIIYNQASSVLLAICFSLTHSVQISLTCERFRAHIWGVVNSAIHTSSDPPNRGIILSPELFSPAHYTHICNMVKFSDDVGYGLLHTMDYSVNPPEVSQFILLLILSYIWQLGY